MNGKFSGLLVGSAFLFFFQGWGVFLFSWLGVVPQEKLPLDEAKQALLAMECISFCCFWPGMYLAMKKATEKRRRIAKNVLAGMSVGLATVMVILFFLFLNGTLTEEIVPWLFILPWASAALLFLALPDKQTAN